MKRREIVFKRFVLHTILSLLVAYPLISWIYFLESSSGQREAILKAIRYSPQLITDLFLDPSSTWVSIILGLGSVALIILGALSMEFHSVGRKFITFPLIFLNIFCVCAYLFSVM